MRFIFLIAIGLLTAIPFAAQAESGFGTGFTEQSAKAFEDPAGQKQDDDMTAAAEKAQDVEPAAGETEKEQGENPQAPEAVETDRQEDGYIFNGEINTDGSFIELTD